MGLHVKDSGVWKQAQEVYVKDGGIWKPCVDVYVKDTTWKGALYEAGSENFTTDGSTTFTVPAGVYTLTATVVGGGGGGGGGDSSGDMWTGGAGGSGGYINEKTFPVTPAEELTIIVGAGGLRASQNFNGWHQVEPSPMDYIAIGQDAGDSAIQRSSTDIDSVESTLSCGTVNTDATVTVSTTTLLVGMKVTGTGIPADTTIASINANELDFELSAAATVTDTNDLTFSLPARATGGKGGDRGNANCDVRGVGGTPNGEDGDKSGGLCYGYGYNGTQIGGDNGSGYGEGGDSQRSTDNNEHGTDGAILLSW